MKSSTQWINWVAMLVVVVIGLGSQGAFAQSDVISFNCHHGTTATAMLATETAGAPGVNVANWNDISNDAWPGSGSISAGNIKDSNGDPLATTTLVWAWGGGAASQGSGVNDAHMLSGAFDAYSAPPGYTHHGNFIVSNIPYATYDVYYYMPSGYSLRGGDATANGIIKSMGFAPNYDAGFYQEADSPFTFVLGTTELGTFLRIEGLSGDLTLYTDGKNPPPVDHPRFHIAGFQIVNTTAATPGTLIYGK